MTNNDASDMHAGILAFRHDGPRYVAGLPAHELLGSPGVALRKTILVSHAPLAAAMSHRLDTQRLEGSRNHNKGSAFTDTSGVQVVCFWQTGPDPVVLGAPAGTDFNG